MDLEACDIAFAEDRPLGHLYPWWLVSCALHYNMAHSVSKLLIVLAASP